ncbi:amidohydrolase family protein [Sphingomonas sp. 1P06PA]|uniref:Xaa-Pro dipeptidase n=1 Tax=Sphingomonas sp. 1P06PA TaxID=554121 RepID=UPI0039A59E08
MPHHRLTLLAACVGLAIAAPAAAETVVVTAARLFDAPTGRLLDEPVVVVTDGRIVSVVTRGGARPVIPEGARRVDLGDMTILPGLIDMHVHLDSSPLYGGYTGLRFTDSFWQAQATGNAAAMLQAGFTTVRNVGSENYNDVGLKQAIEEGLIRGPRIVPAAHALGATGGHCDSTYLPPSFKAKSVAVGDSPEELRQRVREQRKYGAEVIKVCATGGVFSRNTEPGQQQLSEAELRAIAEEAHMWGLKVAAHAHGAAGIKAAIRAGIDTIEHASLIDDEGIRLAKERGAWLAMDIFNTDYTQAEGAKNGVLEDNLRKDREVAQIQRDNFRKAHKAGVKLVFATDAGVMPHATAAGQLKVMVQYGMTPAEALQAATVRAAEALGRTRDVGAIQAGRYGDIIAVAGDPLANVRTLEQVAFVMKGGVVEKGDAPR